MFEYYKRKRKVPIKSQIKFGIVHPIKAFLITVKDDDYSKTGTNKDSDCMPYGICIDVSLLMDLIFLLILNSKFKAIIILLTPFFSLLLVAFAGILGSIVYFIYTVINDRLHKK